jgi:hypothetical protein
MFSSFILENQTTKQKIEFGQDYNNDYCFKNSEIIIGPVNTQQNTYSYPNQVGVSISKTTIKTRSVSIKAYVTYTPTQADIESVNGENGKLLSEIINKKIEERKKILNALIIPDDYIRMYIGDYYIEGKPDGSIQYGKTEAENNEYFCAFLIELYCSNPMFRKMKGSISNIAASIGSFHFPWVLKPQGIILSSRKGFQVIYAENEGNAKIGGIIYIVAKSEVQNLVIENITTGERIKINKTLQNGEKIVINTNDGNDKGIFGTIGLITENYYKYWDQDNKWMKFPQGLSLLGYSTDNESERYVNIKIEMYPEKYNLEVE